MFSATYECDLYDCGKMFEGVMGIAVYDVIGQCVLEMAATNASMRLDVSSLESGVYLLSVSGKNRPALVTRFVVTR